jgi:hypothetical protein
LADADEEGLKAADVLRKLLPHARVLRVDDLPEGHDAADISSDDPEEWLRDHLPLPEEGKDEVAPDFLPPEFPDDPDPPRRPRTLD